MFKTTSLYAISLVAFLLMSSCHRSHKDRDSSSGQQTNSSAEGTKDTLKTNLAANDKNSQLLEDGSVMVITNTIVQNLSNSRDHSTFMSLLEKSGLYKTLSQKGPFTIFAPSNEAFEKLDKTRLDRLLTEEGRPKLEKTLKFHIIAGILRARDLTAGESISTIEGDPLVVIIENGKTKLMDGNGNMVDISRSDILSNNGIIHLTNSVLMPKGVNLF